MRKYFSLTGNALPVKQIAFTACEECGILPDGMPRSTVTQRLRSALKRRFDAEGHGTAARLSKFSFTRPGGRKIRPQDLSYFANETEGRANPITLDDLDDIADYFRVSIGELFDLRWKDLTGDEQRLVLAFRALHELTREHFLALIEAASVTTQGTLFRSAGSTRHLKGAGSLRQTLTPQIYGGPLPTSDPGIELDRLRAFLTRWSQELAVALAGNSDHQPATTTDAAAPRRGKVGA